MTTTTQVRAEAFFRPAAALLILVCGFAAWGGVLRNGFVWDDAVLFPPGGAGSPLRALLTGAAPSGALDAEGTFWRPLVILSFVVDTMLWGFSPAGLHATNLLIHCVVALAVFGLARRLPGTPGDLASLAAALLFVVHPLGASGVAFVLGRTDPVATLCSLGAIGAATVWTRARQPAWLAAAALASAAAMLSKEWAFILPVLVPVWVGLPGRRGDSGASRLQRFLLPGVLSGCALLVLLARRAALPGSPALPAPPLSITQWLFTAPAAVLEALGRFLAPGSRTIYLGSIPLAAGPGSLLFWAGLATTVALFALAAVAGRRRPGTGRQTAVAFATLVFFVAVIAPFTRQEAPFPASERFLYFPLALIAIVCAPPLAALFERLRPRGAPAAAAVSFALVAALAAFGWLSQARAAEWRSDLSLFESLTATAPHSASARYNLARAHAAAGERDEAIHWYEESLRIDPQRYTTRNNLALLYEAAGRIPDAEAQYRAAMTGDPDRYIVVYNLATMLLRQGRIGDAVSGFTEAIRRNPGFVDSHLGLGEALSAAGDSGRALAAWREAVRIAPGRGEPHARYGSALAASGRTDEGIAQLREGLRLAPRDPDVRSDLAAALLDTGQAEEALALCDEAISMFPRSARSHYNRGNALRALNRGAEAVPEYATASEIDPAYGKAINNLGVTLVELGRLPEALAAFDRLVALEPGSARAWNNRGVALRDLGRRDEARVAFERSLAIDPNFAEPRRHLAAMAAGGPPSVTSTES